MLSNVAYKAKYEFIPENERGVAKIKGFLTIMFYASAHNFNIGSLWSGKFMVGQYTLEASQSLLFSLQNIRKNDSHMK